MALAPSQTGSSIKIFILAAALQAGAEPDDIIDGRTGRAGSRATTRPNRSSRSPVACQAGSSRSASRRTGRSTARSPRLSQIVGLYRVVDMTYRMASSTYLYQGQPEEEREPIQPHAAFATGANEMSTLDMAAGMQTIANLGVHQDAVLRRVHRRRRRQPHLHQHVDGERVLDTRVALTEISMLKDVLTRGHRATQSWPTSPRCVRRPARPAPRRRTGRRSSSGRRRSSRRRCWCATRRATRRWTTSPSSSPRESTERPGRHLPGPHLGRVHGAGARVRAGDRLAEAAAADPPARPLVPAGRRMPVPPGVDRDHVADRRPRRPTPDGSMRPMLPTLPMRPTAMSRSRYHRRRCHRQPYRRRAPRSRTIRRRRRFRRPRCTPRSTAARRSRPTCSILGRRFRRHRCRSMLHRADD